MSIKPIIDYAKYKFRNKPIKVIEIGARYGESSEVILTNFNVEKYIIVDPYQEYDEYKNDGFNNVVKNKGDIIFEKTKNKLKKINENVDFFRTFSNDVNTINKIQDNSIDFIFIDGNHTGKYVFQDLENYYPKMKKDGILCGDDFFMRKDENDILRTLDGEYKEDMVFEGVVSFCLKNNLKYTEFGKHRGYGKTFMIMT